jgi:hypothetical protein
MAAMRPTSAAARLGLLWAILTLLGIAIAMDGLPNAQASGPLEITKFSLQTTKATRLSEASDGAVEIVNEPYEPAFTQAGGHPWALTSVVEFASEEFPVENGTPVTQPTRDPKDIVVDLPPGLLGNPMAMPSCPLTVAINEGACPDSTQLGVYRVRWIGGKESVGPIVNVTPEPGQSAEFALENTAKISAVLTGHLVRTKQGYGFAVVSTGVPTVELYRVETTFWGVPADPSHDAMRGKFCLKVTPKEPLVCRTNGGAPAGVLPVPFLTMPTSCSAGPQSASIHADSWEEPGVVRVNQEYEGYAEVKTRMPAVTGCDVLQFTPTIGVQPDTELADAPVGLGVRLTVPLNEAPASNATPQIRDTSLTLPQGLSVSPGVADGIEACDEYGPRGINITGPESEEIALNGELQLAPGHCPDASTVGTAEAVTPFLPEPVKGHVYLARPTCGGAGQAACTEEDVRDGKLYRLYIELGGTGELARTGIHFKVLAETHVNPATGQLTSTVRATPQAPFSELRLHLNGGPRAPLDTPSACGTAVTTSDFTPWSAPGLTPEGLSVAGTPDATPSASFGVTGCGVPASLRPGFTAGTVSSQAGRFSAFTLNLSRDDREQYFKAIQVHTPPGLLGMLSSVQLCGEPQASVGMCSVASRIGGVRAASGAGSHPFEIGGDIYLTGPYGGAPFGLSVATHVVAGPFDLGDVVVRARIYVDPHTSTLTVATDEAGPYAVPQIVFGVPVRLKRLLVDIDRPGFMFNPTNCKAQQVSASVSGTENAVATVSTPFAVGGCRALAFKPNFTVNTSGHTSRAIGASLDAKLSFPSGTPGSQANVAKVRVSLPRELPSRLTTLQKACPVATFEHNPASCPTGSIVGIARAYTQLLPLLPTRVSCPRGGRCSKRPPMSVIGPVYFVSHGGEAFPQLIVVLQGDGVRVDLAGSTFIDKAGITSSTFKTVPDVPVSSFELYLPQGRGSALAANGDLCKARGKLKMPTEFIAQNGAVMRQSTQIAVSGCKSVRRTKTRRHPKPRRRSSASRRSGR